MRLALRTDFRALPIYHENGGGANIGLAHSKIMLRICNRQVGRVPATVNVTGLKNVREPGGGEPQLQNKRGCLTTLRTSNEAENREPQLQNKRGSSGKTIIT